ncbi:MAG: hypothetical protein ACM359_08940 [Bacillota bacterium]
MTMRDAPGGPVEPTDRGANAAGCVWWWWVIALIVVILILWWIFARTRPAYRTPSRTTPVPAMLLPPEPVVHTEWMLSTALAGAIMNVSPPPIATKRV